MVTAYRPKKLSEALSFLNSFEESTKTKNKTLICAGGTDFMVRHRGYTGTLMSFESHVLHIDAVEELLEIDISKETGILKIGAAVPYNRILNTPELPALLRSSISLIAAPGLRNRGTMGGNICNASPAADTVPPLLVHDAVCRIVSIHGERTVPVEDFATGPGSNILSPGELLASIDIPLTAFTANYYRKVGTRRANALSRLSVCGAVLPSKNGDPEVRIAFGAVGPKAVRGHNIEAAIRSGVSETGIIDALHKEISPISDQRSTADYRRKVCENCVLEFLKENKLHDRS